MSYQVLARKYRPKNFAELVGQEHVARALGNALASNRLHHAYLFTGTRGVGKTTIARILAKCLNCETGITATPCGVCSSCTEINEGRFIDLLEIDAASNTGVDDVREVIDNAQYVPTRGRYKVYLIDEVHMLSKSAFNALLKTLEEPPAHVKFLLATTDPQKVPVTVLSRCLQFSLKPMSAERVMQHLANVLNAEHIEHDDGALWELGRAANGSMRDALSLTDQAIAYGNGVLREGEVRDMLGALDRDVVFRVLEAVGAGDAAALMEVIDAMAAQSVDFSAALGALISALHRVALAQLLPDGVDNSEGDRERVLDLAASLTPEDVQLYYQIALHGRRDLPLAPGLRQGFEMCLFRMLAFKPVPGGGPDSGKRSPGAAARPSAGVPARAPARPAASAPVQAVSVPVPPAASSVKASPPVSVPVVNRVENQSLSVASVPAAIQSSPITQKPVSTPVTARVEATRPAAAADSAPPWAVEPSAPSEPPKTATILPFPVAPVVEPETGDWTPEGWSAWVVRSELSGMALNLARHLLLTGSRTGEAVMELSPRHEIMANRALDTLLALLQQDFPQMQVRREAREPSGPTPLEIEQERQRAERAAAKEAFLADGAVQALIQAFDARLLDETLVIGEKR
ncbi:MAG: DNA polymerase III subunit gamma/tau [Fluviicoccus sp.]|uniref:DNA polymerase III subunit gamma/tau n=1 Tax=Fluviicoccus sp. TaxID=2003552 RepID=UPI002725D7D1|nr:DNA polymerase III subunit gamma/tau [Fluviicoccus sp.]MDO8330269.1 DNA polymerase III subunit gamma/tau [Fluviicoccus sp.]